MIGGEDHARLIGDSQVVQGAQDPTHTLVHLADGALESSQILARLGRVGQI